MIKPLVRLIDAFKKLPGVGQKQAERFAFFIVKSSQNDAENLASSIIAAKKSIKTCSVCASWCEESPCEICSDSSGNRDRKKICIVENYTDLQVIEKTGKYKGLYHVLLGVLSPLDGVHHDDLSVKLLMKRLYAIEEILIATNPTVEG
ncbi:MAG: recombination protein RecR, partial [Elusimicrobia bacterium HGW-Elusimicrobia-4]